MQIPRTLVVVLKSRPRVERKRQTFLALKSTFV